MLLFETSVDENLLVTAPVTYRQIFNCFMLNIPVRFTVELPEAAGYPKEKRACDLNKILFPMASELDPVGHYSFDFGTVTVDVAPDDLDNTFERSFV